MAARTTATFSPGAFPIPRAGTDATVNAHGRDVRLTNLAKVFFPATGATKGDVLQYYADVAPLLLPYLKDRAEVMKRYPNGAQGDFFYMKRTPPTGRAT
jgi:bifunctional non-homologous end joining protein LigD